MNAHIRELAEGIDVPCQFEAPRQPPEWLDKDKYEKGREFFKKNPLSVMLSNFRNLVIGLSVTKLWFVNYTFVKQIEFNFSYVFSDILVLTQKTETKKKAFYRYIDTGYFMARWLLGPAPWEDDSMYKIVNGYHKSAANQMRKMSKNQRQDQADKIISQLEATDRMPTNDPLDQALLESVRTHPNAKRNHEIYEEYIKNEVVFSQFDMALVHIAFFASVVVFPERFGAGHCSDDSFECFLHMWKVIGYYLGVEDRFNVVRSNLSETRKLLLEIGDELVLPSVIHMNTTSIHMAKCVTKAYGIDYHLLVYQHCFSHGIELHQLWHKFSVKQKFLYYWRQFFIEWLYCFPPFRYIINASMLKIFEKMHSKRRNSPSQSE